MSETGALLKDSSEGVKPEKGGFSSIKKFVMNNLYLSVFTDLINKSSNRYPQKANKIDSDKNLLEKRNRNLRTAMDYHGHLCLGQVLGVHLAQSGMEAIGKKT